MPLPWVLGCLGPGLGSWVLAWVLGYKGPCLGLWVLGPLHHTLTCTLRSPMDAWVLAWALVKGSLLGPPACVLPYRCPCLGLGLAPWVLGCLGPLGCHGSGQPRAQFQARSFHSTRPPNLLCQCSVRCFSLLRAWLLFQLGACFGCSLRFTHASAGRFTISCRPSGDVVM